MSIKIENFAWHRSFGVLVDQIVTPNFWGALVRLLNEYVKVDNWVALIFSDTGIEVVSFIEWTDETERDGLLNNYVNGLYMLDPFYITNRENPKSGLLHLLDIAPTHFLKTEYYNTYFKHYISSDEVSFNVQLENNKTLCLSLGSKTRFSQKQVSLLEVISPWVIATMRLRMNFEQIIEKTPGKRPKWQKVMAQLNKELTSRQMEVIKLLFSGYSSEQVASKLSISIKTVKTHRHDINARLKVNSLAEIFARYFNR
jgi:DNA-binding CsgD family transcriptional regulator